jgi:hypothetical protein
LEFKINRTNVLKTITKEEEDEEEEEEEGEA